MRVAVVSDVHGNLPALEAVLAEIAAADVERIVCCGDTVAGPFPRECLERLRSLDPVWVRGNGDAESPRAPEGTWDWIVASLAAEDVAFLLDLPITTVHAGVRYCHGSPRDVDEILTKVSPDERFLAALEGVAEPLVLGGHTHVQFERRLGELRFVNPGSVGMPYEGRPGAFWAIVDGADVELRRTPYAVDAAAAAIRATAYPGADEFARLLLEPQDPDEVSAHFESLAA